jgi:tetratricopeptide (TPR) repeat protein
LDYHGAVSGLELCAKSISTQSALKRTTENSPAIHRWDGKLKTASIWRLPFQPSASRTTILPVLIPAVNYWATIIRPLRGLTEALFVQGSGLDPQMQAATHVQMLRSVEVMRMQYFLSLFLLTTTLLAGSPASVVSQGQTAAGGGSLPADAMGGASLIFRKPENPALHSGRAASPGSAGGGRVSGGAKARAAAAEAHERLIAKGNAARSAPTPRYPEAEQQYKLAAIQDPNDARAHAGLGNIYLDQARFNEAATAYTQALKVKADYIPAYQPLAYSLARLNRFPEATETLNQALQYDPNNAEIYNNLAFAYVHGGRYEEAIKAGQQAITLLGQTGQAYKQELQIRNEVLSNAYKNLGNAYNGLKQYNEAADALKHATEIEPNNAAAHFNLGLALYSGGRYSEAIEAYKAVIKLRPELAGAHFNLGLSYAAINDKEGVKQEYDVLKRLNAAMADQLQSLIQR